MGSDELLLINRAAAARSLGISLGALDLLIERKALGVCRVGRRVLLLRATLEAFARSGGHREPLRRPDPDSMPERAKGSLAV